MRDDLTAPEYIEDMGPLVELLEAKKVPFVLRRHLGANPKVKELIGYYPTGEWQVIINDEFSVIRGMASWGLFEIMNIKDGALFKEPERFETAEELVDALNAV